MTTKLKIVLSALFMLAASWAMQAQPGGGGRNMDPAERAKQQTASMTEKLALSEAQTNKVGEINLKYANKTKAARDEADGDWESMRETMGAIRAEQNKELQTVLTADQWTQWQKEQEEMRANRGGRPGGPNGPAATDEKTPPPPKGDKKPKKKSKSASE